MSGMPKVYFIPIEKYNKNKKLLSDVLEKAGNFTGGFTAIKTHFGEPGNENAFRGKDLETSIEWIKGKDTRPFLTDSNTLYLGKRSNALDHLQTARDHGFYDLGLPIVISDGLRGTDERETTVKNPYGLAQDKLVVVLGKEICEADNIFCISHFKGHSIFGFGGALKNLGMGSAARRGKMILHAEFSPKLTQGLCIKCQTCIENCAQKAIYMEEYPVIEQEKCVGCGQCVSVCPQKALEMPRGESRTAQTKTAIYANELVKGKKLICVNFLIRINEKCDCYNNTMPILTGDIGVMVSTDPVAIDQASFDMVKEKAGKDILTEKTGNNGEHILEAGEKIGLGSRKYSIEIL